MATVEPLANDALGVSLELVAEDLERVESLLREASSGPTPFLTETASYLAEAGGKRIRPAVTVLASRLGSGPSGDVFKAAAAIEMTHLATLYHDDVIDEADLRRGVRSVNDLWGNSVAILAGDYLFARASSLAAEVGGEVPFILADAVARVVAGQLREVQEVFRADRTHDHYVTTIEGKTAALLEASARIGALLGGCAEEVVTALSLFGRNFGLGYQVADDLLDLSASKEALGKPPGTDLKDGVYTLPVIIAAGRDSDLRSALGSPETSLEQVQSAVGSTGAFEEALERARFYVAQAVAALQGAAAAGPARRSLEDLARVMIERVPPLRWGDHQES